MHERKRGEEPKLTFPPIVERRRPLGVDLLIAYLGGIGSSITYENWPIIWQFLYNCIAGLAEWGSGWLHFALPLS